MLTLQFIPRSEISELDSEKRIKKLLQLVKTEKIILLEGRLKSQEEAELIKRTMESISKTFKGIEIGTILPKHNHTFKQKLMKLLFNEDQGFTIIGPATVVKEIKQDPGKIQLFTTDKNSKKK